MPHYSQPSTNEMNMLKSPANMNYHLLTFFRLNEYISKCHMKWHFQSLINSICFSFKYKNFHLFTRKTTLEISIKESIKSCKITDQLKQGERVLCCLKIVNNPRWALAHSFKTPLPFLITYVLWEG